VFFFEPRPCCSFLSPVEVEEKEKKTSAFSTHTTRLFLFLSLSLPLSLSLIQATLTFDSCAWHFQATGLEHFGTFFKLLAGSARGE
jgi:hypothetical protein